MKDTEIVALSKMIKTKLAKEALKKIDEGKHEVDMKIHVYGNLEIKDTSRPSTCSIPLLKALALCLHYAGCQRENLLPTLEKAIRHSMQSDQEEIADILGMKWENIATLEKRIKEEVVAKLDRTPVRNSNAKLIVKELIEETVEETETILKSA